MAMLLQRWKAFRATKLGRWSVDLGLLLLVVLAVSWWQTRHHLRDASPELTLPRLNGAPVSLAELRGKPVVLAFWAPWCTVCKAESDNLSRALRWAGARAHVVSVAGSYQSLQEVERYVQAHHVDYPVLLADDATLAAFRIEAFPTLYFLDAQGRIATSASGYTTTLGVLARLLVL